MSKKNDIEADLNEWLQSIAQSSLTPMLDDSSMKVKTVKVVDRNEIFSELWSSSLLVSGDDFSLRFLTFFRVGNIRKIIPKGILAKVDESKEPDFIIDFMKEYCNQTGGSIKSSLDRYDVVSAISTPIRNRTLDVVFTATENLNLELVFRMDIDSEPTFYSCVQLKHGSDFPQLIKPVLSDEGGDNDQGSDIELF